MKRYIRHVYYWLLYMGCKVEYVKVGYKGLNMYINHINTLKKITDLDRVEPLQQYLTRVKLLTIDGKEIHDESWEERQQANKVQGSGNTSSAAKKVP